MAIVGQTLYASGKINYITSLRLEFQHFSLHLASFFSRPELLLESCYS